VLLIIHVRCDETRAYTSGLPTAQAIPHETIPITVLLAASGPPESPMHAPCPVWVNVQIVLSKTNWAFPTVCLERQSALVNVVNKMCCKLFGADPGCYKIK